MVAVLFPNKDSAVEPNEGLNATFCRRLVISPFSWGGGGGGGGTPKAKEKRGGVAGGRPKTFFYSSQAPNLN